MSDLIIHGGNATTLTMSSREIAELTGKEHKTVIRDVRVMLICLYGAEHLEKVVPEQYRNRHSEYVRENAGEILDFIFGKDGTNWNHEQKRGFSWSRDKRGYVTEFNLDRELTITLVSGYDIPLRHRVVTRLAELEARPAIDPIKILSDPAAMRGLLLTYTEKVLTLENKVGELEPKAEALDRLATANGSFCIRDAAKTLQVQEKWLKQFMREHEWIYQRPMGHGWLAYADKLKQGVMEHKTTTGEKTDGTEWVDTQARITVKGMTKLSTLIQEHGQPRLAA